MAGVKGRSGRKTLSDEKKRLRTIEKAWDTIDEYLNNKQIPLHKRADCAIKLTVKDMGADVVLDQSNNPIFSKVEVVIDDNTEIPPALKTRLGIQESE